jgi:hypothetical protein
MIAKAVVPLLGKNFPFIEPSIDMFTSTIDPCLLFFVVTSKIVCGKLLPLSAIGSFKGD